MLLLTNVLYYDPEILYYYLNCHEECVLHIYMTEFGTKFQAYLRYIDNE